MNRKIKDALTLGIAAAFVLMFALWSICKSDDAVSESERRPLKQFPTLNVEEVLSGRFQSNFESYMLDQFPLRDELRTLKALSVRDLFGEKDNNGIYVAGRLRREARRHDPRGFARPRGRPLPLRVRNVSQRYGRERLPLRHP